MSNHLTRENTSLQAAIISNHVAPHFAGATIEYIGDSFKAHHDYEITQSTTDGIETSWLEAKCDSTRFPEFALEVLSNIPNADVPEYCQRRGPRLNEYLLAAWTTARFSPVHFERMYQTSRSKPAPFARGLLTASLPIGSHYSLLIKTEYGKAYLCHTDRLQQSALINRHELECCPGRNEGKGYVNLCAKLPVEADWFELCLACPPFDVAAEVAQHWAAPSVAEFKRPNLTTDIQSSIFQ